jgi:hypothetical protein
MMEFLEPKNNMLLTIILNNSTSVEPDVMNLLIMYFMMSIRHQLELNGVITEMSLFALYQKLLMNLQLGFTLPLLIQVDFEPND